jgi:hypothetical protein
MSNDHGFCIICHHTSFKGARTSKYCARCRKFARRGTWNLACQQAMIESWEEERQAFICKISGLPLEDRDIHSPMYINFDHPVPKDETKRQVTGNVFNVVKTAMDMQEFEAFSRAEVRFWDTGVFDESVLLLKHWTGWKKKKPSAFRGEPYIDRAAPFCVVCHRPAVPQSELCHRHLKIRRRKGFCKEYLEAMIKYWNEEADGIICHYLGIRLDEDDPTSPRYLTFDHVIPGGSEVVPAAAVVNDSKSDLSEQEYRAIKRGLVKHFDGEPFDPELVKLLYWKRGVKPARRMRSKNRGNQRRHRYRMRPTRAKKTSRPPT